MSRFNEKITSRQVAVDKKKEISIAWYSAIMVNETGRKNPEDKPLELALNGLTGQAGAIREFVSLDSLLFRAPEHPGGPGLS